MRRGHDTGCAFLAMDEISTHAAALPTGRAPGQKPTPSVYRMVGMSATLMRLFDTDERTSSHGEGDAGFGRGPYHAVLQRTHRPGNRNKFTILGGGNLLKCLFLPDPEKRAVPRGQARTHTRCCLFLLYVAMWLNSYHPRRRRL